LACGAEILKLELKYRDFDGGRWWGKGIGRCVHDPTGKSHGRKSEPLCWSKSPAAMIGGVPSTQKMPLRTRRSSTRGTPRALFGNIGLMVDHSYSVSS
jgi:hypothetical protein